MQDEPSPAEAGKGRSLFFLLFWRILPASVILLAVVGVLVFFAAEKVAEEKAREHLVSINDYTRGIIQARIANLVGQAENLAANEIIINGLIDQSGQSDALPTFFSSLRLASHAFTQVTLADYKGRPIFSNRPIEHVRLNSSQWLHEVVNGKQNWQQLSADGFVAVIPVVIGSFSEGALHLYISPADLPRLFRTVVQGGENVIVDGDGLIISVSNDRLGLIGEPYMEPGKAQWLSTEAPLVGLEKVRIISAQTVELSHEKLGWVSTFILLTLVIAVVILVVAVMLSAQAATGQVTGLLKVINQIRDSADLSERVEVSGAREIRALGSDFNEMLHSLQNTTASLDYVDSIITNSVDGIIAIDANGVIDTFNRAAERIFGYSKEEMIGRNFAGLLPGHGLHGPEGSAARDDLPSVKITDLEQEITARRKDGESFSMELNVAEIPSRGEPRYVGIFRDISKRKQAEEALRVSEEKFRRMVESAADAIYIHDRFGRIFDVNKAACDSVGYNREELLSLTVRELDAAVPFEELEETWEIAETDPAKYPITLETAHRRKDGSIFPIEVRISILPGEGEVMFLAAVRDISDRKAVEEALRTSENRFRDFTETASDWVWELDENFRFSFASDRFFEIHQLPAETVIGMSDQELAEQNHIIHAPEAKVRHQRLLAIYQPFRDYQYKIGQDEAQQRIVSISGAPVFDDEGIFLGYRGTGTDITELHNLHESLVQAKEDALAAARAKSDFLANISHEIRTPMNGVIGMLELLRGTNLSSEQEHYVTTAVNSADMQINVINDILDYSKIEAGKLELEDTGFQLCEVLEDIATLMSASASSKALDLTCYCAPELPLLVSGDPTRLRQILANLVGNAVKFTDQGEINIESRLESLDGHKARVWIGVRDSGIGISEEAQARLFQAFSQADTSTTRKFGGTGLGLMITKSLVEIMGGEIGLESTPGDGSLFWFRLPLKVLEKDTETSAEALLGKRVLAVAGNVTNGNILDSYLQSWGMLPVVKSDAASLQALVKEAREENKPFDILLLDHDLEDADVVQLAKTVTDSTGDHKPTIILLSSGKVPSHSILEDAGILTWIGKPISKSRLFNILMEQSSPSHGTPQSCAPEKLFSRRYKGQILLVEDSFINQQVALGILTKFGVEVALANNGREAVEITAQKTFDAIFMDVQMPEMDGYEATGLIRVREEKSEAPRTPIIAMTANALKGDRERCLAAGMDDYVPKPVRLDKIEAMLTKWLPDLPVAAPRLELPAESVQNELAMLDPEAVAVVQASMAALPGAYRDILQRTVDSISKYRDDIESAHQAGDRETLVRSAHTLKSNAATLGASELAEMSLAIEHHGAEYTSAQLSEALANMDRELARVRPAIEKLLAG